MSSRRDGAWSAAWFVWLVVAPVHAQSSEAPPFFVEVLPLPPRVFAQQVVEVVLQVGYDPGFVRSSAVPMFAQPLDQPFQVLVPWLAAEPGRFVAVVPPPSTGRTQRIAVGDQVLQLASAAPVERAGRTFQVLQLVTSVRLPSPGTVALAEPQVRYAFATKFVEDFLRGRQAVDRQEATVVGRAPRWTVEPLPAPAPEGFHGAVGTFTVEAVLASRPTAVGDAFTVEVVVRGSGDLAGLPPLPTPRLPGFHVQGVAERRGPDRTVFALDVLALRAGAVAVPPVPFVAFDPVRAAYEALATEALPIVVAAATAPLPERIARLVEADAAAEAKSSSHPSPAWIAVFVPLLAAAGRRRRQRRRTHAALQAALAGDAVGVLAAFEALLAVCAGTKSFDAGTWERLAAKRPTAVAAMRDLHARLDQARFGGARPTVAEVEAVVAAGRLG
ncbi:MAG: BatD family protein [Planctomycetes bacterium]|nr:BatD family protein [Planctomycetota bacterium]